MAARELAEVTPKVLRWARESAGYQPEDVAKKLGVPVGLVLAWEGGVERPTVSRVDKLAALYRRPTALLYMDDPPPEIVKNPVDFRSKSRLEKIGPKLRLQIRLATERRLVAIGLYEDINESPHEFSLRAHSAETTEDVGERLRAYLGIALDEQKSWRVDRSGYRALGAWKSRAEDKGVLVFQASRLELEKSRGISIGDRPLPVVVLSSDDVPVGRIFTLMHELVHVSLMSTGVCDLHEDEDDLERFCNAAAAAALMPRQSVILAHKDAASSLTTDTTKRLAADFSVSQQAMAMRLAELKLIDWSEYQKMKGEFARRDAIAKEQRSVGPIPVPRRALAKNGREFSRLVLDALGHGALSEHKASALLGVSYSYLDDVARSLRVAPHGD